MAMTKGSSAKRKGHVQAWLEIGLFREFEAWVAARNIDGHAEGVRVAIQLATTEKARLTSDEEEMLALYRRWSRFKKDAFFELLRNESDLG